MLKLENKATIEPFYAKLMSRICFFEFEVKDVLKVCF